MSNTLFDRIVASAESNNKDAIKSLLKLALREDDTGQKAREALKRMGVEVKHAAA